MMLANLLKKFSFSGARKKRLEDLMSEATAMHQAGNLDSAEESYHLVLSEEPAHAGAIANLGLIQLQLGNIEKGLAILHSSLEIAPRQIDALCNQGRAFLILNRYEEALASYDEAISIASARPDLHLIRGSILKDIRRHHEALDSLERALELNPDLARDTDFLLRRAELFHLLDRNEMALADFEAASVLEPKRSVIHNNRGSILKHLGRNADALASFEQALALDPANVNAHFNRGVVLQDSRRYLEALESYGRALALKLDYADAYVNCGVVLRELGLYEEALSSLRQALSVNPSHTEARFNCATLLLQLGSYVEGWQLYESRWKTTELRGACRNFHQPLWIGQEDLEGKTILLHSEQGLGDSVQFSRYARLVASCGAKVILEVQPALASLFSALDRSVVVRATGEPLPDFDYHCPLMSLPLAFRTTLETIPDPDPYLATPPSAQQEWLERLGKPNKRRIGLAWSGSRSHKNDHKRSMPIRELSPLLLLKAEFEFHALQKEIREEDRLVLEEFGVSCHDDDLDDFADTAALIACMDMVISVDTSVAHVAGALGKPIWILLPYSPDFRWMTTRTDCPWYPSARLFRQEQSGDWESVVSCIADELLNSQSRAGNGLSCHISENFCGRNSIR